MTEVEAWEKWSSLAQQDCWRWALYPTQNGWIIEHYPENYIGDREEGCGDWSTKGPIASVVANAIERMNEPLEA